METNQSFPERVWETLSAIDVSEHVDTKGSLNFLSWSWAWITMMKCYPESTFEVLAPDRLENGTVMVWVEVTVRQGDEAYARKMWLPIMDHRSFSIIDPTSRDESDAVMRCLVKCFGLFGLGVNIYAGSDLPVTDDKSPIDDEQIKVLEDLLKATGRKRDSFLKWAGAKVLSDVPAHKYKSAVAMLQKKKVQ